MKDKSQLGRCLSLPICLTFSAAYVSFSAGPGWAAHSEPSKPAKTASASSAPAATAATAAKEAPPELTPATLLGLVRSAKIFDTEFPVHVTIGDKEVTLSTLRHPKANDQDCKIDAVLAAKTVMDVYPKEIARVRLMLSTSNSDLMQEVMVTTGDVKAYATGTISKDDLLTSLELKKADPAITEKEVAADEQSETKPVAQGRFRRQRQLFSDRIDRLKDRGTGTQPFEDMLAKIESDALKPESEIPSTAVLKEIKDLGNHLFEQEEAYRNAQHIAKGTRGGLSGGTASGHPSGGNPAGGNLAELAGHFMLYKEVQKKVQELANSGQNVDAYEQQLAQVQQLRMANDRQSANKILHGLANQLHVPIPNRGMGHGQGFGPGGGQGFGPGGGQGPGPGGGFRRGQGNFGGLQGGGGGGGQGSGAGGQQGGGP